MKVENWNAQNLAKGFPGNWKKKSQIYKESVCDVAHF